MIKHPYFFYLLIAIFGCTNKQATELIKSYEQAHNAHDIDKSLSFFHQEIIFELKGVWTKSGKEAIRSLEEWDAALNSHLKFEFIRFNGDSVFCKIIESNDWFRAIDMETLTHEPTVFIIKNDLIHKILAFPSEKDGMKIQAAIGSVYQWSSDVQDSTIYELIQGPEFIYSEAAAKKWLKILARWKDDHKGLDKKK